MNQESSNYASATQKDLLYLLSRKSKEGDQHIPAWTGFNSVLTTKSIPVATIGYLPFIRASPSDLSTIYTILLKLVHVAEKLNQSHILVTADLAIYSKAQEILWTKPVLLLGKVSMRLGGMHLTMAFLASIGKLFGDGGLHSLLTESGVYADATAQMMLQGKQLSRGVRAIKLVNEALGRLFLDALEAWLAQQNRTLLREPLTQKLRELQQAFNPLSQENAQIIASSIEQEHLAEVQEIIAEFQEEGSKTSETFAYWNKYMEGSDVLLHLMRSERDADFDLQDFTTMPNMPQCM